MAEFDQALFTCGAVIHRFIPHKRERSSIGEQIIAALKFGRYPLVGIVTFRADALERASILSLLSLAPSISSAKAPSARVSPLSCPVLPCQNSFPFPSGAHFIQTILYAKLENSHACGVTSN